jgi:hypothetical protein
MLNVISAQSFVQDDDLPTRMARLTGAVGLLGRRHEADCREVWSRVALWHIPSSVYLQQCLINRCDEPFRGMVANGPPSSVLQVQPRAISFHLSSDVYLDDHHVVSVQQPKSSLESFEQRRDNLSAFRLVEVDDLVADLCDICKRGVREREDPKEQEQTHSRQ